MPAYRLVTFDGPMQLTPGLAKKLQAILSKIAEAEKASSWMGDKEPSQSKMRKQKKPLGDLLFYSHMAHLGICLFLQKNPFHMRPFT